MPLPKLKEKKTRKYTVEEYLEMDRTSTERHEYIDGEVFFTLGESDNHGIISVNVTIEFGTQLKGRNCQSRVKDAKIKSGGFSLDTKSKRGIFSYPDLVVICGKIEYHDKQKDVILNPKVIIEVLSESTEKFDRNDKFTRYQMFNSTLTDYILVSQDKPQIEHFIRQDDGSWKQFKFIGLDKNFTIDSIECTLHLSEIYDRIEFSEETHKFLEEIANIK